jgi:nanoRNase/pAp phosphatase (c-di-AMP/oligoRNAs hydrolase)
LELIIYFATKELDLVELFCFFCNHVKTGIDKEDVLFLVDHYIPCANEVVGCIDHHPGVCVFSAKENFFEIASSSCTKIIFDLMLEAWMEETKDMVYRILP